MAYSEDGCLPTNARPMAGCGTVPLVPQGGAEAKITSADRTTGINRGVACPTDVAISVTTLSDGRMGVEFSSKGPKGQDADLNDRFTRYSNSRMGR